MRTGRCEIRGGRITHCGCDFPLTALGKCCFICVASPLDHVRERDTPNDFLAQRNVATSHGCHGIFRKDSQILGLIAMVEVDCVP